MSYLFVEEFPYFPNEGSSKSRFKRNEDRPGSQMKTKTAQDRRDDKEFADDDKGGKTADTRAYIRITISFCNSMIKFL